MLKIGSVIDGKYKILNVIGKGGMSIVYLAMNEKANKQWAIKEITGADCRDLEIKKREIEKNRIAISPVRSFDMHWSIIGRRILITEKDRS